MSEAIKVLNNESLRIALISDDKGLLLGTLTDGDVRRALINNDGLSVPVESVMNKNPTSAHYTQNSEQILSLMKEKDFTAIPLVDDDGKIVGTETINHLIKQEKRLENTVFIMAGGFGKRLGSITKKTPKPLLNIGNMPILETIIRQLKKSGLYKIVIASHYKSEMFVDYFGDGDLLGVEIEHIYEKEPLGTVGALGSIDRRFNDPVLVMNADLLTEVNFKSLIRYHNKLGSKATVCVQEYTHKIPFGKLVINKDKKLEKIIEKPVERYLINAGIYVLEPEILKLVPKNEYYDMTQLFDSLLSKNLDIGIFPIHEYWLDIGQKEDYEKSQKDFVKYFSKL